MPDQASEGLASPFLRRRRLHAALPFLEGRILDVGCGSGALARYVDPGNYFGVDVDEESLLRASREYPLHQFDVSLPRKTESFDTVVALAVIEHVKEPARFLAEIASLLRTIPTSRIVVTTPHPAMDWIHHAGASIGLFSSHASEEHETLLDRHSLAEAGTEARLRMIHYRRFLLGANQIAVYSRS